MAIAEILPAVSLPELAGVRVSESPIFDAQKARLAREIVDMEWGEEIAGFDALGLALRLTLYNHFVSNDVSTVEIPAFFDKFDALIAKEKKAASPSNPLPLMGFEVDAGKKALGKLGELVEHRRFSEGLGFPHNRQNLDRQQGAWEFSTRPSHSVEVQMRILSELLKSGFVPHLKGEFPQESASALIKQHLDDELISLHINLNIPRSVQTRMANLFDVHGAGRARKNMELFCAVFPLAFSSPERIEERHVHYLYRVKQGEQLKTEGGSTFSNRLEVRALEVRTHETYRLMKEIQALAGSLFAGISTERENSDPLWRKISGELTAVLDTYGISPDDITEDEREVAYKIRNTNIQRELRSIITIGAREVANILAGKQR